MGYVLMSTNGQVQYNINEYYVDYKKDLEKLPPNCSPGSRALCGEDGNVYIKKGDGSWKEL